MVVPFIADQPFWGRIVHDLGVGSAPIARKKLTAERLATALRQVTMDEEIRQNVAVLGEKIRAEDGIGETIRVIERLMENPQAIVDIYHRSY